MKGHVSTQIGNVVIDNEVLEKYAGSVAVECIGVVGMAAISVKDGIVKLLKRESASSGVNVTVEENKLNIDLHIIVAYGVSISAVADNLINNVKYKVEHYTGLEVENVSVYVEAVRVMDEE